MKRTAAVLLMIAGCSPALRAQAPARDAPPPAGTAVIRGRVIVAGADRPLSRVEVRAVSAPLRVNQAVLTDGNGRYEIGALPAGRYVVSFSRTNYVRASHGQRRALGQGAPIDVADGQIVPRIDAALQRAAVITGRVLDEFGDPVTNVQVMPMQQALVNGERRLQPAGLSGFTNDLGEYRIHGLTPGRYFIGALFRNDGYGDTADRSAYAPTYYPGTGSVAEAQRLTVAAGQTLTAINMTALPVVALHISGVALDGRGRPLAGGNISLTQRFGNSSYGSNYGQVRVDGRFSIGGVTPGEYSLQISQSGAPDAVAAADVTVSTADVTDLQVVAVEPSTLRGRVVFEPGEAKPPAPGSVRVNVTHPRSMSVRSAFEAAKDDGTFAIKTGAGHTVLRAAILGNSDWRLQRVRTADGGDVTDSGFEVPTSGSLDGLVVELTSRHAEISGTVVDAAGTAARDYVVIVYAQDPLRWPSPSRYIQVGRPDQDNVFRVRLPAGDYFAAAFELEDPNVSLNDPDVLQQLRDRAATLSIRDGDKKTLPLTLVEPPVF